MRFRRWRDSRCAEQVANADRPYVGLSPASDEPARLVREAWAPLLSGQKVPLIGERVFDDDDYCLDQ